MLVCKSDRHNAQVQLYTAVKKLNSPLEGVTDEVRS